MKNEMKIIAFYLPQFHEIEENNKWWGKGFTEWTNVKKAKSLFEGHVQPKIPLNHNYYNLLDDNVKIWQSNLAKEYGIYGFCYYHYWYNGHMLLEKPMEQMLNNKSIDIPFCIWWCNQPWTKSWIGNDSKILISQKYGDKTEWINHYNYFRKFFLDDRYIKNSNKPILGIYQPEKIIDIDKMNECWQELAKKDGFDGIDLMCTIKSYDKVKENPQVFGSFDHFVEWGFSLALEKFLKNSRGRISNIIHQFKNRIFTDFERIVGHQPILLKKLITIIKNKTKSNSNSVEKYDYDIIWNNILSLRPYSNKSIPGAFVNWDNTARYGINGSVMINASPDKFQKYLSKQIDNARDNYNSDYIFLQAWNEWAEWSVLEPDEINGYSYLESLREALTKND